MRTKTGRPWMTTQSLAPIWSLMIIALDIEARLALTTPGRYVTGPQNRIRGPRAPYDHREAAAWPSLGVPVGWGRRRTRASCGVGASRNRPRGDTPEIMAVPARRLG